MKPMMVLKQRRQDMIYTKALRRMNYKGAKVKIERPGNCNLMVTWTRAKVAGERSRRKRQGLRRCLRDRISRDW